MAPTERQNIYMSPLKWGVLQSRVECGWLAVLWGYNPLGPYSRQLGRRRPRLPQEGLLDPSRFFENDLGILPSTTPTRRPFGPLGMQPRVG